MQGSGLIRLVAVTAVVVGIAIFVLRDRDGGAAPASADSGGGPVAPALEGRVNDVVALEVQGSNEQFTVERDGEDWRLVEWGGYPVKFEVIKKALVGLADLERDEPKTERPERYAKLGVEGPGDETSSSVRVIARDAGGTALADVIVGNRKSGATPGRYVRVTDDPLTWLSDNDVDVPAIPSRWVSTEVLRLPGDRMARVQITHPDGEVVEIVKEDAVWALSGIPEGKELRSQGLSSALGSALGYYDFDSVADPGQPDVAEDAWTTARFETTDGLVVLARVVSHEGKEYVRFGFDQIEVAAPAEDAPDPNADLIAEALEAGASAEEIEALGLSSASEPQVTPEDVAADVADLTERVSPWTFVVSSWRADALRKRIDDFVQDIEVDEESDETFSLGPLPGAEPANEDSGDDEGTGEVDVDGAQTDAGAQPNGDDGGTDAGAADDTTSGG